MGWSINGRWKIFPRDARPVNGPSSSTDNAVPRWDGTSGKLLQNSGVIIDDSNNVSGVVNLTTTGNTIIGDAAGDTITFNASTWTMSNDVVITRTGGTVAAGTTLTEDYTSTYSGDSGGTTDRRGRLFTLISSGTNNIAQQITTYTNSRNNLTSGTIAAAYAHHANIYNLGAGVTTNAVVFDAHVRIDGTGGMDEVRIYNIASNAFLGTGRAPTVYGFRSSGGLGHATLVDNAIHFQAPDASAGTLVVGFDTDMVSGTGKWAFRSTGTANSAFTGNVRIGSTTAPTVALDVTGAFACTGSTTLGDASGDTLTINAGTWTLGNNYTATRAIGTAAAGAANIATWNTTFSGDSGGTSSIRGSVFGMTASGGNAIAGARLFQNNVVVSATATTAVAINTEVAITVSGSGNVTDLAAFVVNDIRLSSSGNVTNAIGFDCSAPTLSSTGAITTMVSFLSRNQGHASLVTNAIGFDQQDFTGSLTLTAGFRSQMSSGTGKWGFYESGSANNAFNGSVRIGSTTAPTVPLDVTGDINGSTNFTAWASFTPTLTGWTDVGSPTITGRYCRVRNVVFFQIKVVPGTTTATTAGTSYTSLPVAMGASGFTGDGSMENASTFIGIGICVFDVANSRCYVPTQAATGNTLEIAGWYEV